MATPVLVIEDGTVATASANSYVTVAEVTTFCSNHGLSSWDDVENTERITAILRAMAYIETFDFKGHKTSVDNPLEWPRACVYSDNPSYLSDWNIYIAEIPKKLKNAVCRAAYEESVSPGTLQPNASSNIQSTQVDVISISYFKPEPSKTVFSVIEGFLKGLLNDSNQVSIVRV
jgi:hypothetical protein